MHPDPLLKLCQFVSETRWEKITPPIRSHVRLTLLDTIGAIIAGSGQEEVSRLLAQLPTNGEGPEKATCLGRSERVAPLTAAMVNGIAGSSLELEEGNSWAMGHPAIQLIPAIIAECEKRKASGEELLAGLIAGYESAARVSRASSLRKGLHPTGTWGTVGAALGVGRIDGRGPEELHQIANISASFAISPNVKNSFVGRNVSATFAGVTNYFGLLSNIFFDCGIRSDESNLRMTFSRFVSDHFQEEELGTGLGEDYFIANNYFKPYPSCRFTHSPIDALKAILQGHPFQPDEVEGITVETFQAAMHCETKFPPNPEAVRFSIPYLFGVLLVHGDINLQTMGGISIRDHQLKTLAEKVEMKFVPQYEDLRPRHNPTKVIVRLKNGQELTHEVMNSLGDLLNPLGEEAIVGKFISLAGPVIGKERAEAFWERISRLEREANIEPLIGLLRRSDG
jgi:2-methylcitrate dehydratase PrpD